MAVQGYVVKAETFYDMKLRKEGEIVAAGIDLAAVYPSFSANRRRMRRNLPQQELLRITKWR